MVSSVVVSLAVAVAVAVAIQMNEADRSHGAVLRPPQFAPGSRPSPRDGGGRVFVHLDVPLPSRLAVPLPGRLCEEECHPPHAASRHYS